MFSLVFIFFIILNTIKNLFSFIFIILIINTNQNHHNLTFHEFISIFFINQFILVLYIKFCLEHLLTNLY